MNVLVCYNPPKEEIAENQFDSKPKIASKLLRCGLPVECAMQYIMIFELYSTFPDLRNLQNRASFHTAIHDLQV